MPGAISMRSRIIVAGALSMSALQAAPVLAAGNQVYATRCSMCHQSDGAGVAGQFPRLKGRVGQIAGAKDGRAYLIKVVLFGMFGPITVDGRKISGMMPPMGSLSDHDAADTLNFLISLEKPKKAVAPFTAAEIKATRQGGPMSAAAVSKVRTGLAAKGIVP